MTAIDGYLDELDCVLRGPRRVKADLLREARDSLVDASEAYRDLGLDPGAADRRAVDDFGVVARIAPGYQAELALAQGRRTALLTVFVLAVQPPFWRLVSWLLAEPDRLPGLSGMLEDLVSWLGTLALVGALLAVWVLGHGTRLFGARPGYTRLTGIFACALAPTFSLNGLLLAFFSPTADAPPLIRLPLVLVVLVTPMALVAVHGSRCLSAARAATSLPAHPGN
ncbi:permease prefix domain 1-containing protein [Plantactinospora sp. WMMB782]|uniref:permease prefix domain 1-containing protein n=1 Tax=Plantactinospora sp. WMMB782 TaxID=3404121 RepID=UPI003B92791C